MGAKCPTCGQRMPAARGWKIRPRDIARSHYVDGALAWLSDGEEGLVIGMSGASAESLARAASAYAKAPTDEGADNVSVIAVELAARELAPLLAAETPRKGQPIIWRAGAKAALIARAEALASAAVKAAQEMSQ